MWTVINESRNNLGSNNSDSKQACDISSDNFNDYFTNVAPCLINDLPTACENPIQLMSDNSKFMSLCSNNAFEFTEVSMVQVRDVINDLKNSNCKDVDNLNVNLIKTIRDLIISPLTKLVNLCIKASVFPDCLKVAFAIPIHKKGNANDPNNYRPISILPVFSKILEKLLYIQLGNFFENNQLFADSQFGFRKVRSTTDAALSLTNTILQCFEKHEFGVISLLDLAKAFDCVSHDILLKKLHNYTYAIFSTISPHSCSLLSSFLSGRHQLVKEGDSISGLLL